MRSFHGLVSSLPTCHVPQSTSWHPTISPAPFEQWIKEGKRAIHWTRPSYQAFRDDAVRPQLQALAHKHGELRADAGDARGR
jgi:hypothetical protein